MQLVYTLVATFGYLVVLLVVMAESAGLPVPGETSLLIAGAFAATGKLWLPGVIAAAALGAILGDTAGYWVGRTSGLRLLRRHGRLLRFDERKLQQAEAFFARHGEKTVFLGRFVPVGRIFSALLAGVSRMHYRRFLLWNAAGGIVWATLMGILGYAFGNQLPLIERLVRQFGLGVLFLLIAAVAVRFAIARRAEIASRSSQLAARMALLQRRWQAANATAVTAVTTRFGRRHLRYLAFGGLGLALASAVGAVAILLT
ncbi:MAG: DedA family protein [Ktedonobacterales bacterium]